MNVKRTLIALSAMLISMSSYAFSKVDLYGGVSGGFSNLSNKYSVDTKFHSIIDKPESSSPINSKLSANGISGDVFLGMGKTFNRINMNLRAEIDGNLNNDKISYDFQPLNDTPSDIKPDYPVQHVAQKLNYSMGASVLPGFYINPNNLLYSRAGIRWASFESQVDQSSDKWVGLAGNPGKNKQNLLGYEIGLGIQSTFYKNFALRAEYDYTGYQKPKVKSFSAESDAGSSRYSTTYTSYYSNQPSTNAVTLGLVYYIGKQTHNPNHYMDPVAWLQNKFSHGQVMQNEDQTMVASNDQGDKVKASDTSDSQQPNQDMTVIAHQDS